MGLLININQIQQNDNRNHLVIIEHEYNYILKEKSNKYLEEFVKFSKKKLVAEFLKKYSQKSWRTSKGISVGIPIGSRTSLEKCVAEEIPSGISDESMKELLK